MGVQTFIRPIAADSVNRHPLHAYAVILCAIAELNNSLCACAALLMSWQSTQAAWPAVREGQRLPEQTSSGTASRVRQIWTTVLMSRVTWNLMEPRSAFCMHGAELNQLLLVSDHAHDARLVHLAP